MLQCTYVNLASGVIYYPFFFSYHCRSGTGNFKVYYNCCKKFYKDSDLDAY